MHLLDHEFYIKRNHGKRGWKILETAQSLSQHYQKRTTVIRVRHYRDSIGSSKTLQSSSRASLLSMPSWVCLSLIRTPGITATGVERSLRSLASCRSTRRGASARRWPVVQLVVQGHNERGADAVAAKPGRVGLH